VRGVPDEGDLHLLRRIRGWPTNQAMIEACVATSTRISRSHRADDQARRSGEVDDTDRVTPLACRYRRAQDRKSKRTLMLGELTERYACSIADPKRQGPNDWVFPQDEDLSLPRWDSGVRKR
jgi:hypothetical protein